MKKYFVALGVFFVVSLALGQSRWKIGDNPYMISSPSALFELESGTRGFLPPRMTQASMTAITPTAIGLTVYCTDCAQKGLYVYTGVAGGLNNWFPATVYDAATNTKGLVQLTHHLGGTAASPTVTDTAVLDRSLTGFTSTTGTISTTTTLLNAIKILNGNVALKAPIASPTFTGTVTVSENLTGLNAATSTIGGFAANINNKTTSYTLTTTDNGKIVVINSASAVTLTVPSLFVGFNCMVVQLGIGQVTILGSGATVTNRSGFTKTAGQNAIVTIMSVATANTFISSGDMSN